VSVVVGGGGSVIKIKNDRNKQIIPNNNKFLLEQLAVTFVCASHHLMPPIGINSIDAGLSSDS
jgi:hypothetical protein